MAEIPSEPPYLIYEMLRTKFKALYMLGEHSTRYTPSLRHPPFDRRASGSAVPSARGHTAPVSPMLDFLIIPFFLAGGWGALDLTDHQTEVHSRTFSISWMLQQAFQDSNPPVLLTAGTLKSHSHHGT